MMATRDDNNAPGVEILVLAPGQSSNWRCAATDCTLHVNPNSSRKSAIALFGAGLPRSGAASRAGRNAKAFRSKEEADLWHHSAQAP
jgi:hypothetical protein